MNWLSKVLKKYEGDRFYNEIIIGKEYRAARTKRKADVVIDVGSLSGEFSMYMYDRAQVIYALEPYSDHFVELYNNIKDFELTKIKPFRLALSNYNGEGTLAIGSRGGHKLISGSGNGKTETVDVKTLATFMKDEKIDNVDILKIDIENGEIEVFTSPDFEKVARKINFIIGEHSSTEVSDALHKYGFYFVNTPRGWIAKRI